MSLIRFKFPPFKAQLFKVPRQWKLFIGLALLLLPCAAIAYESSASDSGISGNTAITAVSAAFSAFDLRQKMAPVFDSLARLVSILDIGFSKISMLHMLSEFLVLLACIAFLKAVTFARVGSAQRFSNLRLGFFQIGLAISVAILATLAIREQQEGALVALGTQSATGLMAETLVFPAGSSCGTIAPEGAEIISLPPNNAYAKDAYANNSKAKLLRQATWSEVH
ncbi:MAG: hypothetical protein Q8T09_17615 [Candidatus Melainabacteria bacterium]|nr:hypothetical protein [Candidatus Melainabacteria bacterium]